jgi:ABC-type transport system involved in Fe-S cluster assembly fused permease/ATPase subunit
MNSSAHEIWYIVATSSIDHETDAIIQNSLRHKLDRDITIIIVAHRLQTIMDADKIVRAPIDQIDEC